MSTIQTKTVRLGDSATLANNFELSVPAVPDGTLTLQRQDGTDVLKVQANGTVELPSTPRLVVHGSVSEGGEIVLRNVGDSADAAFIDIDPSDDLRIHQTLSRKVKVYTNSAQRATFHETGRVEIHPNEQGGLLTVNGGIVARSGAPAAGTSINGYTFTADQDSGMFGIADGTLHLVTNNLIGMSLTAAVEGATATFYRNGVSNYASAQIMAQSSSGDVIISLHASGASAAIFRHVRNVAGVDVLDAANTFIPLRASAFTVSSDYRIKENIVPLTGAIERLMGLNACRFNYTADSPMFPDGRTVDGFLAHEVAEIVPEAVVGSKDAIGEDGKALLQALDHSKLVPLLVASVQDLKTQLDTALARIAVLESNTGA